MIDRYLLRYLLAVADRGSFSRAAAQCGVSQPTLSVGIAKLEAELGERLFLRSNRRVELTGAGARLVERARRIEREFTLAEQETRVRRFGTALRLGVIATLPATWMERAIGQAVTAAPDERVEIVDAAERQLLAQLDRGRLDAILSVVRPGRERFAEILFEEGYGLALPVGHALAGRDMVEAGEVADDQMVVRRHCELLAETSRYFTSRGVRPFMSARTTSDDQALAYVRSGLGLTVMPDAFAGHGIAMARLDGLAATRAIGFVYGCVAGERPQSAALRAIGASLRAAASGAAA